MSFDMKQLINVTNRTPGMVVYKIPEHGIRREFYPKETKKIPYEELVWLSYIAGGRAIMQDCLLIEEPQATQDLNIHTEPEYFMNEQEVIDMLLQGSLDQLLDALDFAPVGVIEIIKAQAVSLPIYDMQKREAIYKATGFNVNAAIENSKPDEDEIVEEAPVATRRVQQNTNAPTRRTEGKYKVISTSEG